MVTALPPDGVSVALLTPVTEDGAPDLEALDRLAARAAAAGVAGLSPAGSTGEGARLSHAQRRQVVARTVAAARGLPVIAGVPPQAIDDTVAELAGLADAGADAALVAPPGYYPISDEETVSLFEALADRSPVPLVLYHIPALARAGFSPAVVGRLARHPSIVGIKDSGRDLEYLRSVVRAVAGEAFAVATGADALLTESLDAGATAAIVASPNVAPSLAAAVFAAWRGGDRAALRALQDPLLDLVGACRRAGFPSGWKTAAALTGACSDRPVPPGHPLPGHERERLRQMLRDLGIIDEGDEG